MPVSPSPVPPSGEPQLLLSAPPATRAGNDRHDRPASALQAERTRLRLNLASDVQQFRAALTRGEHAAALREADALEAADPAGPAVALLQHNLLAEHVVQALAGSWGAQRLCRCRAGPGRGPAAAGHALRAAAGRGAHRCRAHHRVQAGLSDLAARPCSAARGAVIAQGQDTERAWSTRRGNKNGARWGAVAHPPGGPAIGPDPDRQNLYSADTRQVRGRGVHPSRRLTGCSSPITLPTSSARVAFLMPR